MDPIANVAEQTQLAKDIMAIWDKCPKNGEFSASQLDELACAAYRLAELIQSMAG